LSSIQGPIHERWNASKNANVEYDSIVTKCTTVYTLSPQKNKQATTQANCQNGARQALEISGYNF